MRRDGVLLAQSPSRRDASFRPFADQVALPDHPDRGLDGGVALTQAERMLPGGAGMQRLEASRVLSDFPLVVNTTITEDVFLANWRASARAIAAGTAVI